MSWRRNARRAGFGSFVAVLCLLLPLSLARAGATLGPLPDGTVADLALAATTSFVVAAMAGIAMALGVLAIARAVERTRG